MPTISLIIPAYNEEERIAEILGVVVPLLGSHLHEIIAVDDCSKDNTKAIIRGFSAVRLIEHAVNGGKSSAVASGVRAATGAYIFLLDADLKFLSAQNIIDLTLPIQNGSADFAISHRKNAWPLFPFKDIDYLSGERIIKTALLLPTLDEMAKIAGYGLEVFINRIVIENNLRIKVVAWPNVENHFNQHKYGWVKGVRMMIKIWLDVLSVVSIPEMYRQNFALRKLLIK